MGLCMSATPTTKFKIITLTQGKVFDSLLKAAKAYNEAALKYHGEFAVLNDLSQAGVA
jgi:hypothetical protein